MLIDFRERWRQAERKGERHLCARETSIGCLWHTPWPIPETDPATQSCALTGIELTNFWFTR